MAKKFQTVEERRAYWRQWYQNNKHRQDYKDKDQATKKRIRKERREWYINLKKNCKCSNCGISDYRVLDFHHPNPNKKDFGISSNGVSRSFDKCKSELDKCILLCANCHGEAHYAWDQEKREIKLQEIEIEKRK